MRLYDIPEAIRDLMDRAVDPETGEINELLEGELDDLQEEFERKAEYIALLSREAKAEAEAEKAQADVIHHVAVRPHIQRARVAANREERLKNYLHACLRSAGVERVETDTIKIRRQANTKPTVTVTVAPESLPEHYRRVTVEADRAKLLEDWKADGVAPDGVTVEYGEHIRVT